MKTVACMISAMMLLTGCVVMEEAYYVDREYGLAQQFAWDSQVAYRDYRHAAKTPEGTEGITAEEVMSVYNQTFAEAPTQVDVFQLGISQ